MPLVLNLSLENSGTNESVSQNFPTQFLKALFTLGLNSGGELSSFAFNIIDYIFSQIGNRVRLFRSLQGKENVEDSTSNSEEEPQEANEVPEEKETKEYSRGDTVRYMSQDGKKGQIAVIVGVHTGEVGGLPFYTIRLSTGREKQTELSRLRPITSYALPGLASETDKKDVGKRTNIKKVRSKSKKNYKRKRRKGKRRQLEGNGVCPWNEPGQIVNFLISILDETRNFIRGGNFGCNDMLLSLIPSLTNSMLPLLSDEDRDKLGLYLTKWVETLESNLTSLDSNDVESMHFLTHVGIISSFFCERRFVRST